MIPFLTKNSAYTLKSVRKTTTTIGFQINSVAHKKKITLNNNLNN